MDTEDKIAIGLIARPIVTKPVGEGKAAGVTDILADLLRKEAEGH